MLDTMGQMFYRSAGKGVRGQPQLDLYFSKICCTRKFGGTYKKNRKFIFDQNWLGFYLRHRTFLTTA